jgi:hypothetical protein
VSTLRSVGNGMRIGRGNQSTTLSITNTYLTRTREAETPELCAWPCLCKIVPRILDHASYVDWSLPSGVCDQRHLCLSSTFNGTRRFLTALTKARPPLVHIWAVFYANLTATPSWKPYAFPISSFVLHALLISFSLIVST